MTRYVLRRLAHALIVLWGAITLSFLIVQATPGDPARLLMAGSDAGDAGAADDEALSQLRLLLAAWQNPIDPGAGFLQWRPNYTTVLGYKVLLTDVSVGGQAAGAGVEHRHPKAPAHVLLDAAQCA